MKFYFHLVAEAKWPLASFFSSLMVQRSFNSVDTIFPLKRIDDGFVFFLFFFGSVPFIDSRLRLWPQFTNSLSRHIKHPSQINWPCRWPNEAVRSCKFPHDCEHQQRLIIIEGLSFPRSQTPYLRRAAKMRTSGTANICRAVYRRTRVLFTVALW